VDEGEQAGQGLVRVDACAAGPAAEQALLEAEQGGGALVAAGLAGRQPAGGIGEHQLAGLGPGEDVPQRSQAGRAVGGPDGPERLHIADAGGCPVILALPGQEDRHVPDGAQAALDGLVGAGPGTRPAGTVARVEQVLAEPGGTRAQRRGDGIDQALAACGPQRGPLVWCQGQATGGESAPLADPEEPAPPCPSLATRLSL
jgi:hypothetical protein